MPSGKSVWQSSGHDNYHFLIFLILLIIFLKMSSRLFISLFLLGVGIGSPWLVRDWLNGRSGADRSGRILSSLDAFSDGWKKRFTRIPEKTVRPAPVASVTSAREPYPLASHAARDTRGFLPPSLAGGAGEKIPFLGSRRVPTTPRTRIITTDTGGRLREGLADLALALGDPVFIRVFKEESELEVWLKAEAEPHFTLFKVYRLTHSSGKPGPKLREGDGQAPEGFYSASTGSMRPETRHHLGIDLGFPNAYDSDHGFTGSDLMIHGGANSAGAFALAPKDMEEVYTVAESGLEGGQKVLRIHIFPFRMTDKRMDEAWKANPSCLDFWVNLKSGYDFFENVRLPPVVTVEAGLYVFRLE